MRAGTRLPGARLDGDQLEAPVCDPPGRQQALGNAFQLVAAAAQNDHLETPVFVEVDVQCRPYVFTEPVLELGQPLGELAHVMVVDQGQCSEGGYAARNLRARDFGPDEIAQDLGTGDPSRFGNGVEIAQQGPFHRHTKADQLVAHRKAGYHSPSCGGALRRRPASQVVARRGHGAGCNARQYSGDAQLAEQSTAFVPSESPASEQTRPELHTTLQVSVVPEPPSKPVHASGLPVME